MAAILKRYTFSTLFFADNHSVTYSINILQILDMVTFQTEISSKVKNCKCEPLLQVIRENNVYVTYSLIK